jgi:hypothetical protein
MSKSRQFYTIFRNFGLFGTASLTATNIAYRYCDDIQRKDGFSQHTREQH